MSSEAIAALAATAALAVELVEAGVLDSEAAAQAISRASEALSALPKGRGEPAVAHLDGLALRLRAARAR